MIATYFRLKALTFHYSKNPKTRIATGFFHSHSMVPGGLLVMSYTTRLTWETSLETAYLRAFRRFPRWNIRCRETWAARAPSPKVMNKNTASSGVLAVWSGLDLVGKPPLFCQSRWFSLPKSTITYFNSHHKRNRTRRALHKIAR